MFQLSVEDVNKLLDIRLFKYNQLKDYLLGKYDFSLLVDPKNLETEDY